MRKTVFVILLFVGAVLAFGVGLVSVLQTNSPDSRRTVDYIQQNEVTSEQALSAKMMAEANKIESEAKTETSRGFLSSVETVINLVAWTLALILAFGFLMRSKTQ